MTGSGLQIEMVLALVVNAVVVGMALATLRQTVRGLTEAIHKLDGRMAGFDGFCDQSSNDRARINVRLDQLERGADDLRRLRDELAALSARSDARSRELEAGGQRLRRALGQLQRQIANLATGRAGVAFTSEPFTPPQGRQR